MFFPYVFFYSDFSKLQILTKLQIFINLHKLDCWLDQCEMTLYSSVFVIP